jgi:hypothetical protein
MSPTQAPTADELLQDSTVIQEMEQAWLDSLPNDPANRHEEGGWIYMDLTTGKITTLRAPRGVLAEVDLGNPPHVTGSVIVGTFHTHPNPSGSGRWKAGPSRSDMTASSLSGVPWLIRADNGYYWTGPNIRRGGLTGSPGYPP